MCCPVLTEYAATRATGETSTEYEVALRYAPMRLLRDVQYWPSHMLLRACYEMSGTDRTYAATRRYGGSNTAGCSMRERERYASPRCCPVSCYARATRCRFVLTKRMLVPGDSTHSGHWVAQSTSRILSGTASVEAMDTGTRYRPRVHCYGPPTLRTGHYLPTRRSYT
eukprot:1000565-Rhodomonas_salina.6